MDTEQTRTLPELSVRYVLLGLWFGLLVAPAICCACLVVAITYWTLTASRRIASAMMTSWRTFNSGELCWFVPQKPRFVPWGR